MHWRQAGCQRKRARAGSGWTEPQCPELGTPWWHVGTPTLGTVLPGQHGLHRDVSPLCPAMCLSLVPGCTPGLLQCWFLKHSLALPGPAVPMALGTGTPVLCHTGLWGEVGAADSASRLPLTRSWISKGLHVCRSHPSPAAGSSTQCHPGPPSDPPALEKEFTLGPCAASTPQFHYALSYHNSRSRSQGHEDTAPAIPARQDTSPTGVASPGHRAQIINPPRPSQTNLLSSFAASCHPKGSPSTQPGSPSTQVKGAI